MHSLKILFNKSINKCTKLNTIKCKSYNIMHDKYQLLHVSAKRVPSSGSYPEDGTLFAETCNSSFILILTNLMH